MYDIASSDKEMPMKMCYNDQSVLYERRVCSIDNL